MESAATTLRVRRFKLVRVAWPLLFIVLVASLKLHAPPLAVYSLASMLGLATLYLVLWRCLGCRKLYAVKPTLSSTKPLMGIVWPYFSRCVHCDHPLEPRLRGKGI
jgi:hypothetical protein